MKSRNITHHPNYDGAQFSTVEDEIETLRGLAHPGGVAPSVDSGLFYDVSKPGGEYFTPTSGIEFSGTNLRLTANARAAAIVFDLDGGGAEPDTGLRAWIQVPFSGTITAVRAMADQTGSIVCDIWKDTFANFPPSDADSITASAPVTISAGVKSEDTTLTGWTTAFSAGDILACNIDSVSTITHAVIELLVSKT
jgi:hypothetical protein